MAAVFKSFRYIRYDAFLSKALLPPIGNPASFSRALLRQVSSWGSLSLSARAIPRSYRTRRFSVTASTATQEAASVINARSVDPRVPVTVLTGLLGSGKTTLLNYVLNAQHGKRIAIILNEYGEVDIDGSLVAAQKQGAEDILMLNNGCLCCTVRGDLVKMISELVSKKSGLFDHIVIETAGLANPGPIIDKFLLERRLYLNVTLEGILTIVDAKHAPLHLDEVKPDGVVNKAVEQIAYADRIILNKIDLVGKSELDNLTSRIKHINEMARMQYAKFGTVDMDYVLDIGGFDALRVGKEIMDEGPSKDNKHAHHDEHGHHEFDASCDHEHDHDHHNEHGNSHASHGVSSVSIVCGGTVDVEKIHKWIDSCLVKHFHDIYRTKGVLSVHGTNERVVFHGVRSYNYESGPDRLWGPDEKRTNKIVFIGKDLDKEVLEKEFKECFV